MKMMASGFYRLGVDGPMISACGRFGRRATVDPNFEWGSFVGKSKFGPLKFVTGTWTHDFSQRFLNFKTSLNVSEHSSLLL